MFIKGKIFVYVRGNICRPLRQIGPETGESLAFFFVLTGKIINGCILINVTT